MTPELAKLLYQELIKAAQHPEWTDLGKLERCYQLLLLVLNEVTKREKLRFVTLFSRMAFVSQKYRFSKQLQYYLHTFRKLASAAIARGEIRKHQDFLPGFALKITCETIQELSGEKVPDELAALLPLDWPSAFKPADVQGFRHLVRALALEDLPTERCFLIKDESRPEETVKMRYDLPERNDLFNPSIEAIRQVIGFPVILHLLEVEVDQAGIYRPQAIVVEPDHLIDVTAIAECFNDRNAIPEGFLLRKYLPFQASSSLLLGHIANFFLDELLNEPRQPFKDLFKKVFALNPLAFCLIDDATIRKIQQDAQRHFVHLQRVITQDFAGQGISAEGCYLEPTFYSDTHGIQGRLDALYRDEKKSAIVELKSGKLFKPNIYQINNGHFVQTLLYDLIIRAAFGEGTDPANYILYSVLEVDNLKFAPVVKAQQWEALQVRNQLVALEHFLLQLGLPNAQDEDLVSQGDRLQRFLRQEKFGQAGGFVSRDAEQWQKMYGRMGRLEKAYFTAFTGFIAREHKLAKTGQDEVDELNGQASLWLNDFEQKQRSFSILSHLELEQNGARDEEPIIVFRRSELTNELANFRTGDIAVLYPFVEVSESPLRNQLFKCTLIELTATHAKVRLRSRQFNDQLFRETKLWCIEHDLIDNSFVTMYQGLYHFAMSDPRKRDLILSNEPPAFPHDEFIANLPRPEEMTEEQAGIFQAILRSKDYFLLWGPPGTGKTSVMLKHLVGYWVEKTEETLLLLAYTNRAVDEICEAIEAYDPGMRERYLRIGSRYSTAPAFQERLLNVQTEQIQTRKELKALIQDCRIMVGTVASVTGKPELFALKSFDRIIIDEASQILEPLLTGVLPKFKHFLLIGDHQQLPAVVAQSPELSQIHDEGLRKIGLNNLRNSLFERLFKRAQDQKWDHAYAQLRHQGRMHREIMTFPSRFFYENRLDILPKESAAHFKQLGPLLISPGKDDSALEKALRQQRMIFLSTPADYTNAQKINRHEAELLAELVARIKQRYEQEKRPFSPKSLGVITPYRAQISQIRQALRQRDIDPELISIDTVERYQGGARDIIIISLALNSMAQLRSLVSLSEEGIDRKLNVALTRAREQLIILGNEELLMGNPVYAELMKYCREGERL
jgi:DNA replication ATP-dependent helicase Dna2